MAFDVVFIRRLLPTSKDNRISHQKAMHDASLCLLITPTFLTLRTFFMLHENCVSLIASSHENLVSNLVARRVLFITDHWTETEIKLRNGLVPSPSLSTLRNVRFVAHSIIWDFDNLLVL